MKKVRYYCEYGNQPGEWLGMHTDGLSDYHVILFDKVADKEVAEQVMLCYTDENITWKGISPGEVDGGLQTVAFAEDYPKYRLF